MSRFNTYYGKSSSAISQIQRFQGRQDGPSAPVQMEVDHHNSGKTLHTILGQRREKHNKESKQAAKLLFLSTFFWSIDSFKSSEDVVL